jgi:exodeoxyribonuclease III
VILKLLSYNIRFGGAGRENHLAAVIKEAAPDLVVFQEAILPRVIEQIAAATGMRFWVAKANHSIAYCSRIEIAHHEWHYPRGSRHPFLEIHPAGTKARIFGVHLRAMFSRWGERRRKQEIQSLLTSIKKHQEGFHALVGDFNSLGPGEFLDMKKMPRWIRAMVWLSGRDIQRETVKLMLDSGYADGYRLLHPDITGYTFPTREPHLRFDYVFVPLSFIDRLTGCDVMNQSATVSASDHFPLLAHLDIPDL